MLQERDLQILEFIARFGYCQEPHLCKLLNVGSVRNLVTRLSDDGYITKQKVIANNDPYLSLGKKGATFLETKVISKVSLATLFHDTLLVDLYLYLQGIYPANNYSFKTDKELRRDLKIELLENEQLAEIHRVPDILINDEIAIELELSEKPKVRLQAIINSYVINEEIIEVNYYLQSAPLARKIKKIANNHPKFKFWMIEKIENQVKVTPFIEEVEIAQTAAPRTGNKKFGGYTFL